MPTGYTYDLQDSGFNVKKWLNEKVIRAFLGPLRESNSGLNKEQILQELDKSYQSGIDYHTKEYNQAIAEQKKTNAMTMADAEKKFKQLQKNAKAEFDSRLKTSLKGQEEYRTVIHELQVLKNRHKESPYQDNKLIAGVLKFAIEQCEGTVDHDYNVSHTTDEFSEQRSCGYGSAAELKSEHIKMANRDVTYHKKELQKTTQTKEESMKAITEYFEFLEEHLK